MAEVGKSTGKKTQAGREVYETPDGEMVSEKSTTFKYKGKWINVPTIHNGYAYDDDILRMMLDAEVIKPTSIHKSKEDAIKSAIERSKSLKFDKGGLATQTEEALGWTAEGKKLAVDIPEVSFKDAATFVAEMTPIVGDALAAKEVYDELQKDEPNYYLAGALGGAALVGLVPGLGDAAAKAIKKGAREVFDAGKRLTSKTPSKSKPSYTDTELLEADDIIDEWGKGNLTNTELRNQMRDKGFTIETKRISPKKTGDDLEVVGPDGNIIPWKDMPRGVVKKSSDKDLLDGISKYFKKKSAPRFEESAIATAANQNDLSREILVEMPIDDFLAAAKKEVSPEKLENTRRLISEGTPFETVPSLQFKNNGDGTAKVIGHDGRHRAMALKEQGETTIPVRLQSSSGDGPSIRWGQQNNPSSSDYVDTLPKQLVEEDGEALINMPDTGIRRKEDLGFNEDVYHYTTSEVIEGDKFNPDKAIGNWNKLGVHVGGQKASRDRFTGINDPERYPDNVQGSTLPLKARTDKPLMFSDEVESEYSVQSNLRKMAEARGLDPTDYAADLRKQLAEEGYTHIPYINEVEAEGTISYIMLVDRPEGSDAVVRSKFAEFDPSKKDKPELGLAQGGEVGNMNMKKQMSLFEYGGIADDGMDKDPVSGNNVPPGSLAKEVRDDIPAMLSEGEYVVPADVLRYYGVNFFENLRGQAKQGLNTMEQNGRIGGTPMTQQDVARNMQQPMAPAPVQAAQGAMMQSPMRVQQQPAPQAVGNSGIPTQGYAGEDGSIVSRWSPARARYSSPMFQGTSSQQANIQTAQEQAATESITYMRTHYNQNGESIQVAYEGTDPASATPKAGQDQLISDYPLTEEEWIAYKSEMSQNTGDDGGSGGGGDTTVSGGSDTSWMSGINFDSQADVKAWVDSAEGLGMSGLAKNVSQRGGILGAVPQAIQAQDIAKVRGLAEIYKELNPELSAELTKKANDAVNNSGSLVISALDKLGLLSGDRYSNDPELQKRVQFGQETQTETAKILGSSGGSGDDDDPFVTPTVFKKGDVIGTTVFEEGADPVDIVATKGGTKYTFTEDPNDDDSVFDDIDAQFEAAGVANNTGGLMVSTRSKKKKSKPKKTGLAGKK